MMDLHDVARGRAGLLRLLEPGTPEVLADMTAIRREEMARAAKILGIPADRILKALRGNRARN